MKQRKIMVIMVTATLAVLLAACGKSKNQSMADKQVVNWSEKSELPTMDISTGTDEISFTTMSNTNEGLLRLGKDNKAEMGVAKDMKVSKDGKTYTFNLRKDAKWSNGDPVTAQDFVYSWQRTNDPKTGAQYSYLFSGIKNADQIQAQKKPVSSLGIKADGEHKLIIQLDKPISYFKLLLGFPSFFPQDKKIVEKYGSKYGTASKYQVYNGPFKLEGWTGTNLKWSMVKNNEYWDKKAVKLNRINDQAVKDPQTGLNQFQSKQLDETVLAGTQVKNLKNNRDFISRKQARNAYLEFNQTKAEFKNEKIRQAIGYAIDRKQLANDVLADGSTNPKGFVTDGLAKNPKTGEDFAKEAYIKDGVSYDLGKAKELWKQGLKEEGKKSISINLLTDDADSDTKTAEFVQNELEKLPGLKVSIQTVPYKTRLARSVKGQFDMVLTLWGADFADPITDLGLFTSDNSFNNGKWKNAEYDKLINSANNADANNPEKRWDDMVQAEKVLMKNQGVVPLFNGVIPQMMNSKIKGLVYNTAGIPYNWKNAYIEK
ncbi:peptide ABC transporter substrate-binding protein [Pediococcus claussenii]|uniref:peptide ABC transporter substrate-binding protein n=1 Tax=Pediococcus claussenii TaxID=187452 RepID=UPI00081A417A|nr:peptide ABC transporter substrate-binding protein [Pediococcus claussenii]ANZ69422.1 peptide ABC transporter substrate-binding protein [Pediococcus claussenii]